MAATTANHTTFAGFQPTFTEQTEAVAADRVFQNSLLTEIPGAAFAFLTLAYLVLSLAGI
ncbi:MAG TPA: hypothetical protein VMT58_06235 [Candidatus Binataceae bacterium]|nr:hypothetical protein [Candidatus Binataceae bacterium]